MLFGNIKLTNLIKHQDDIIEIIRIIVIQTKIVSPSIWKVLELFPSFLKANDNEFGQLLHTINAILVYGKSTLQSQHL